MKNLLLLAFSIAFCSTLLAQAQPKIRYNQGFLSYKFEIGDKDASQKEVKLHLEKTSPNAAEKYHQSEVAGHRALLCSIIMLGGAVVGIVSKDADVQLYGYSAVVAAGVGTLIFNISRKSKLEKSIDIYNRQFGY